MSTASLRPTNGSLRSNPWLPIALGLAALCMPTHISLWNGVWNTEEQGHGPLILAVALLLAWIVCLRREAGKGLLHCFCGSGGAPLASFDWLQLASPSSVCVHEL